ncbi:MAG: hypothetical protein AAFQ64_16965 [Pseudomonadota bacterium]
MTKLPIWKPPTLLLVVGALLFYAVLYLLRLDTTGGAPGDLRGFHLPSIQIYRDNPFITAMQEQYSAMGPLYYAVFSQFAVEEQGVTFFSALAHCTGFVILLVAHTLRWRRHFGNRSVPQINITLYFGLVTCVFLLNSFIVGPAIWGNPEGLAFLFMSLSVLCIVLARGRIALTIVAGLCFALLVLTRQSHFSMISLLWLLIAADQRGLSWPVMVRIIVFSVPCMLAGVFLVSVWSGLTPPRFAHHAGISIFNVFIPVSYVGIVALITVFLSFGIWLVGRAFFGFEVSAETDRRWKASTLICGPINPLTFILSCTAFAAACRFAVMSSLPPSMGGGIVVKLLPVLGNNGFVFVATVGFAFVLRYCSANLLFVFGFVVFLSTFSMTGDIYYQRYFDPYLAMFFTLGVFSHNFLADRRAIFPLIALTLYFLGLLAFSVVYYA